jgi:hypothetical protein
MVEERRLPSDRCRAWEYEVIQLGIPQDISGMESRRTVDLDVVDRDACSARLELQTVPLDQDLGAGGKARRPGSELQRVQLWGDREQYPAPAGR